jgi:hypothetical protein
LFNCHSCNAELPGNPRICPHCGADQGVSSVGDPSGAGSVGAAAYGYHPTSAAYEANWSAVVPLTPPEALDSASAFMVSKGFVLESRTENSANFGNREEPNAALGCFLLLFLIIPGVIYLLMGGSDQHTTLLLVPEEGGSRVLLGGDSARGRQALRWWAENLASASS